ncbi:hypothetical protein SH139x_000199 [Planctomycetaceae bacterium SH139]
MSESAFYSVDHAAKRDLPFLSELGLQGRWVHDAFLQHYVPKEGLHARYLRDHLLGMGRLAVRTGSNKIPRSVYR